MKAIIQQKYGPPEEVLELREMKIPQAGAGEVLVRVVAAPVAGDDWHLVRGLPLAARPVLGLRRPRNRVPGLELAGRVMAVGEGVDRFRPGDEVCGWCRGAFAEYAAVAAKNLVPKPQKLTFGQAAALPISGFTALQALRDRGDVRPGQQVLINGAAGGVGTMAVQIARALGAEITGVCGARNSGLVRSLGAVKVIDYAVEDFTRGGRRWELIVDMIGNHTLAALRRALAPRGILVMVGARGGPWFMGTDRWLKAIALSPFIDQRLRPLVHQDRLDDLEHLWKLAEEGRLTPVIDRNYPLAAAAEAIRSLESRLARGKVIIETGTGHG